MVGGRLIVGCRTSELHGQTDAVDYATEYGSRYPRVAIGCKFRTLNGYILMDLRIYESYSG